MVRGDFRWLVVETGRLVSRRSRRLSADCDRCLHHKLSLECHLETLCGVTNPPKSSPTSARSSRPASEPQVATSRARPTRSLLTVRYSNEAPRPPNTARARADAEGVACAAVAARVFDGANCCD